LVFLVLLLASVCVCVCVLAGGLFHLDPWTQDPDPNGYLGRALVLPSLREPHFHFPGGEACPPAGIDLLALFVHSLRRLVHITAVPTFTSV